MTRSARHEGYELNTCQPNRPAGEMCGGLGEPAPAREPGPGNGRVAARPLRAPWPRLRPRSFKFRRLRVGRFQLRTSGGHSQRRKRALELWYSARVSSVGVRGSHQLRTAAAAASGVKLGIAYWVYIGCHLPRAAIARGPVPWIAPAAAAVAASEHRASGPGSLAVSLRLS